MIKKFIILISIILILVFGFAGSTNSKVAKLDNDTVLVYDRIESGEILDFLKCVAKVQDYKIIIHSPGGSAHDALAIMQRMATLKRRGAKITTESTVAAYSGGAFIWIMGGHRIAHRGDMFMFHLVQVLDEDMKPIDRSELSKGQREYIEHLDAQFRQLVLSSVRDTRITNKLLKDGDNWFTAEELHKMGLVDELI
jgi:ATP-dependent protease ClpP protease subunit